MADFSGFVGTRGTSFIVNEKPIYLNGFNSYWSMMFAADYSTRNKVTDAFQKASETGLNVAGIWAFNDGDHRPLESSPGSCNEEVFKGLDFVIAKARKLEIYMILSLMNNWKDYGGKDKVAYKDDPTILAWELKIEPCCPSDPTGSNLQYNPNSNLDGTDFIANNKIPDINFATIHLYPESWLPSTNKTEAEQLAFVDKWIESHVLDSNAVLEKPIVISEFGKSYKLEGYSLDKRNKYFQKIYDDVYNSARLGGLFVGGMFWQLMTKLRK
ncbi:hypothetical protein Gotri_020926 [Gossypium trilobum]|uniref:mannan endo-1,4-beta-mannosidase n=1 Tax=Gossypium trilobum TaxID=34281 RepID=A0A7J9DB36_9ROSI|nr:hypothetical protein [Gossypium trilobum]